LSIQHIDRLDIRCEIWGHSNFDDSRLPTLNLHATKGLSGAAAIVRQADLTNNWRFHMLDGSTRLEEAADIRREIEDWPITAWGGWMSTRLPQKLCFRRKISLDPRLNASYLVFQGLKKVVEGSVNGGPAQMISPFNPFLDLGALARSKEIDLCLAAEQHYPGELSGRILLLQGLLAMDWQVRGFDSADLLDVCLKFRHSQAESAFPFLLGPGQVACLSASTAALPHSPAGWVLQASGKGIKLAAFLGERFVGRIWLPGGSRPVMKGGKDDLLYLPGAWLENRQHPLTLLLEGTGPGELIGLKFRQVRG
jgi:beta-galactosidase